MYEAGTGFEGNVSAADDGDVAFLEGVLEQHVFKSLALGRTDDRAFQIIALEAGVSQFANEDQRAFGCVDQVIVKFGVGADGFVGRQGPRSGRPDHGERWRTQMRQAESLGDLFRMIGMHFESDVDGRGIFVLVLDFRFGQRRAAVQAPVDRLQTLVEVAFFQNLAERTDLVGFGLEGHRQVGVVPLAENAEADEVLLLAFDLLSGKGTGQRADLVAGNVLAVQFFDLVFNWQAMAVPARNVRRVETGQCLGADDDVLEYLVDRMADVNIAVGVGRAVVQDEQRASLRRFADLLVEFFLLPGRNPLRLALGEIAAHGEGRVGEVKCVFVVSHL